MTIPSIAQLREKHQKFSAEGMKQGKVPWFHPERIERQGIADRLQEAMKYLRGRVLDVGCGDKPYKPLLSDSVSQHVGLDMPSGGSIGPNVYGSVFELPFKTDSFDGIISTQVLEHLPTPQAALNEMFRVLRPGGVLVLTAPMAWELHAEPYDYYRFTKHGLHHLAHTAGFSILYIKPTTGVWGVIGQRLSSIVYQIQGKPENPGSLMIKLFFCFWIQLFFKTLDTFSKNQKESLGNILVAQK